MVGGVEEVKAFVDLIPTLIFTWVLLRSHFSRGLEGVNSDTSFPSSSRMLEFSCLMTYRRHFNDSSSSVSLKWTSSLLVTCWQATESGAGYSNVDSPVSGEKTRHQWTPSMMHGRGAVKPRWGKQSEHRGSTGQSPAALCPTNVLRLNGENGVQIYKMKPWESAWGAWCDAKVQHPWSLSKSFSFKPQSSSIPAVLQLKEGNPEFMIVINRKIKHRRKKIS